MYVIVTPTTQWELLMLRLAWQQVRLFRECGDVGSGLIHWPSELNHKERRSLKGESRPSFNGKDEYFFERDRLITGG